MHFIGIDPGRQGQICLLDSSDDSSTFISLNPDIHNARDVLANITVALEEADDCAIALELVHSLGGMSAKSNFTFGGMFWRARTILDILGVSYELVTPKAWQQAVGVPAKKDRDPDEDLKQIVCHMALNLYPKADLYGPRGGLLDGRSDALMIAHYLRLKHGG
jgi:hypothetical protein